jgi:FkbM family methyltransferase
MYISYAQNFEDVYLNRLFGHVAKGFYIDIGACHPTFDSVTKHFYDRGWSGINVEPSPHYFRLLNAVRHRDINLNVAVGTAESTVPFYEIAGSGYSSLGDDAVLRANKAGVSANAITVKMQTLQSIVDTHVGDNRISFLKVDVEGHELEVLKSINWQNFRPKLVLLEAIHPDTREPAWHEFESYLLDEGYIFALFDGLNRYYLSREHSDEVGKLQIPPNIFDEFRLPLHHTLVNNNPSFLKRLAKAVLPTGLYFKVRSVYLKYRESV